NIVVLEAKVGETTFRLDDERQVVDYALDLRDFHAGSRGRGLLPVLWCTDGPVSQVAPVNLVDSVANVQRAGKDQLRTILRRDAAPSPAIPLVLEEWDASPYQPVPTIIQAATSIFAGHDVREIVRADADNLAVSASRIVSILGEAKRDSRKAVVF